VYLKVCVAILLMSVLLVVTAVTQMNGDRSNMSGSFGQAVQESTEGKYYIADDKREPALILWLISTNLH
jgi:hypothetical protein